MGANDDLDGKTTHFYPFLDTNEMGQKCPKPAIVKGGFRFIYLLKKMYMASKLNLL